MTHQTNVATKFAPSGLLLETETALGRAIEEFAVAKTPYSPTILDLLVRLSLATDGQLRGVDLCRQMLKSPGYVSRVIDDAEKEGLVARQPDPDDRRAQLISLTEVGEATLTTFVPDVVRVLDQTIYTALADDEVRTLVDLLSRVNGAIHNLLERH